MVRERFRGLIAGLAIGLSVLSMGSVSRGDTPLTTELVASGFTQPLCMACPPNDPSRIFIVEKAGRIRIIKDGVLLATPFLDINTDVNSTTLEWGLLGMTFHPDYQNNGYFYLNYNETSHGDSVIARFQVGANPDVANPASKQVILYLVQPNANHRGGWLGFGADGYLYDSQGDGGGQNDPSNRAQNINLLQGKILRLDVDGPDGIPGTVDDDGFPGDPNKYYHIPPGNPFVGAAGADEIWAFGLRNPWRCSFDRQTGDLWIGDVGQFMREEIDVIPHDSAPPLNFGWRCMEAELCTGMSGCTCNSPTLTPKVHSYERSLGVSVTGGYLYRGCTIPDLQGTYFYADYQTSRIWSFRPVNGVATDLRERTAELDPPGALQINSIAAFGEDLNGEMYLLDLGGEVFKLVPAGGGGGGGTGTVSFAIEEGFPPIISPCRSFSFDVRISACNDAIVDGATLLAYRFSPGVFETSSLVAIGNSFYRATLPAAPCGSTPEFYLSAASVLGGVATLPPTAPDELFSVAVGVGVADLWYEEDFESGLPAGWSTTGLWSVTSACPVNPVCDGGAWAYYGETSPCNYDIGANSGTLSSSPLALPESPQITLTYCSTFERESFAQSDWPTLLVNGAVVDQPAAGGRTSSPWEQRSVDLSAYSGRTITLEWHFSTGDAFDNAHRGWQVDDVSLTTLAVDCGAPGVVVKGDMDQDGDADGGDIITFVAAAMIESNAPEHVCPGDFTDDGRVTADDVPGCAAVLMGG